MAVLPDAWLLVLNVLIGGARGLAVSAEVAAAALDRG